MQESTFHWNARARLDRLAMHWTEPAKPRRRCALPTARKLVQSKFYLEMSLRGILRGFGLKSDARRPKRLAGWVRELVAGHRSLEAIAEALLSVHEVLQCN
jgi:hypothetical protein